MASALLISGIGATATLGAAGISALGSGGGGGGGMSGFSAELMAQLVRDTARDSRRMVNNVYSVASNLQSQVANLGSDYKANASQEELIAIDRINNANQVLANNANALSDNYAVEVQQAIRDLAQATEVLNLGSRQETLKQLSDFETQLKGIEGDYQAAGDSAVLGFDTENQRSTAALATESKTLGDTFMDRASSAQSEYLTTMNEATSLDPGRLAMFSQAADQLSKSAQQTRMDLLATADPRALELSAIADENASALMSGRVSADVQANLARSGAMRALQGGFGGGGEMGRNLQARDLGLTSLDLMRQGTSMFDAQRRLNYDTRVAGTQVDAAGLLSNNQNLLMNQGSTLLDSRMKTAVSDRDQRLGVATGIFNNNTNAAGSILDSKMNTANSLLNTRSVSAGNVLDRNLGNLDSIYANRYNTVGNIFNTRNAVSEKLMNTGLAVSSDAYKTTVDSIGNFYDTNSQIGGNIFGASAVAANNAANLKATAEQNRLSALTSVRTLSAGTMANAYLQDMMNTQAKNNSNSRAWSSVANTGSSLLGMYLGKADFSGGGFSSKSAMQDRTQPGTTGSWNFTTGWVPKATAVTK